MLPGGSMPMADPFSDPLRFLVECHGRIRERLAIFRRTAEALRRPEGAERAALESALLFLRTSGEGHTVDEEVSLFPRLRERLRDRGDLEQVEGLLAEHREHDQLALRLTAALQALDPSLLSGDGLPDPDAPRLPGGTPQARAAAEALENLAAAYEGHIPLEDEALYPRAREVLTAQDLEAIAAEMRDRRRLGRKLLG
jgi:hemerythrin-like domain-containing protein